LAIWQVLAVVLRPKKDQKIRPYWNVYHHTIGYATIIVIIINIFEGLHVLQPNHKWRRAYIIVLIILGAISIILELVTWILWFYRRKAVTAKKLDDPETEKNGQVHRNGMQSQYKMGDDHMTSL
jgi:heme/copper-type cytochrome/quinol oxidase subunit 2